MESYKLKNFTLDWREARRSSNSSSTIGLDRQNSYEKGSASADQVRLQRHDYFDMTPSQHVKNAMEDALGGRRQGIRTETFDAEMEVTRGSHVKEEYLR